MEADKGEQKEKERERGRLETETKGGNVTEPAPTPGVVFLLQSVRPTAYP